MSAYYNENDPGAAEWLRNLIAEGLIAPGDVDERSIVDVQPEDLRGYVQCHFFAGIGGWSYALRLAGWPDERPVWTGSCPCQPFSVAGKGKGTKDERHLWPEFQRIIAERNPAVIFGEQVASKAGRSWLSGVRNDLEALGYAVGAADLCAAGIGAPHIRQRLWWVADAKRYAAEQGRVAGESAEGSGASRAGASVEPGRCGSVGGLAYADRKRHNGQHSLLRAEAEAEGRGGKSALSEAAGRGAGGRRGMADAERSGVRGGERGAPGAAPGRVQGANGQRERVRLHTRTVGSGERGEMGDTDNARSQGWGSLPERTGQRSPWASSLDSWIPCGDGKARRIEPGIEPLANGVPARVALLRGYGNAIVPQIAEIFIRAWADTVG